MKCIDEYSKWISFEVHLSRNSYLFYHDEMHLISLKIAKVELHETIMRTNK